MLVPNKKLIKLCISLFVVVFFTAGFFIAISQVDLVGSLSAPYAHAQSDTFGTSYTADVGLPSDDIRLIIVRILRAALGFLAVVAIILIIIAGVVWMTAGGDSKKVEKAQKIMLNTVIGLIIIFIALAIVQYIFGILNKVAQPSGPRIRCTANLDCWECVDDGYGGTTLIRNTSLPTCGNGPGPNPEYDFGIKQIETSTAGSDYKTDVYQCSRVQTIFNHRVSASSFNSLTKDVQDSQALKILNLVPSVFSGSWQVANNAIIFKHPNPSSLVFSEDSYQFYNPKLLQDSATRNLKVCRDPLGCELDTDNFLRWDFEVGDKTDTDAPKIIDAYPSHTGDSDRNVDLAPILYVEFSESIDSSTVNSSNIILQKLEVQGGGPAPGVDQEELNFRMIKRGFVFTPVNYLEKFAWYKITVENIEDLCGLVMEPASHSWEFQTNDRAPGIRSVYPANNSTKICPDTVISVTFNTSMWDSEVIMLVTDSDSNTIAEFSMPEPQSMVGPSYSQDSIEGIIGGNLQIMDTSSRRQFRTYTYYPASPLSLNTQYTVYVDTTKQKDIEGNTVSGSWDFTTGSPDDCVCMPHISTLTPDQGLRGECITLSGYCFGGIQQSQAAHPTQVTFTDSKEPPKVVSLNIQDDQWDTDYDNYRRSYVTTTIPPDFSEGDNLAINILVDYDDPDYGTDTKSNQVNFYVKSDQVATGPCLWSLRPNRACYDRTLTATGVRFGNDPGENNRTTDQNHFDLSSGSTRIPDANMNSWDDNYINLSVPRQTVDGDAFVTALSNQSNPIWFDLSCGQGTICHDDPNNCGESTDVCAPGLDCVNVEGTCRCVTSQLNRPCDLRDDITGCQVDRTACGEGYYCSNSTCRCLPGPTPRQPRVLKVWPKCSSACVNAGLGAWFSKPMDSTSFNNTNIKLYECGADGQACSLVQAAGELSLINIKYDDTSNLVDFVPNDLLAVDQWYRVVMENIVSADSPALPLSDLNFEGNTAYSWLFKTKDDPALCQPSAVYVRPEDVTIRQPDTTFGYMSWAVGSPDSCNPNGQVLNSWVYDWAWSSTDPTVAGITSQDNNSDGLGDPRQTAQVNDNNIESTTHITAGFDTLSAFGILTTDFGIPDCTLDGECPNSVWDSDRFKCTPEITFFSPLSGPIGTCVTIQGCHFGNRQGFGQVTLGDMDGQEVSYTCNYWTDREIVVQIPEGASSNPFTVITTHGLSFTSSLDFSIVNTCQGSVEVPDGGMPCLCSLSPDHGGQGTQIGLSGNKFGNLEPLESVNQVLFSSAAGEIAANPDATVWSDSLIKTSVPPDVVTGNVTVESQECRSNSLNFTVTVGGIDEKCDSNINTPDDCEADDDMCAPGLFCDQESDCTCQLVPGPSIVAHFPADLSQDVCRNTAVSVTFNQTVNTNTLNQETFQLIWPKTDGLDCDGNPIVANTNFFKRITNFIKKIFHPALAQTSVWCPVPARIQAIHLAEGSEGCTNPDGCTRANLYPDTILDAQADYRIFVHGGDQGVKNRQGGYLAVNFITNFKTGSIICKINNLTTQAFVGDGPDFFYGYLTNQDYFTCAADNCPDDISPHLPFLVDDAGNQHAYFIEALDQHGHILNGTHVEFEWTEVDPENIIKKISDSSLVPWMKYVTPENRNGNGRVIIRAYDPNPDDDNDFGSATTALYIANNLCQNPWPSRDEGFPFVDDTCPVANFSTFYCRDSGQEGFGDDLPALNIASRPCNSSPSPDQPVMREHLWTRSDNADAIGIRILSNPQHLSPSLWYKQNAPNPTGSASQTTVDGYQAIQDGRTTYVNAANLNGNTLYTNIYLISYSQGADSVTKNIFNQLLDNWEYNHNINTWSCGDGSGCYDDSDCLVGTCQLDKDKVIRDLTRIQDMTQIGQYLEDFVDYCDLNQTISCSQDSDCPGGRCIHYPHLRAGSYVNGLSTSRWPLSWTATLANELNKTLPDDPVNEFGYDGVNCLPENGFIQTPSEQKTCYTAARGFECPEYSHLYTYQTLMTGDDQEFYLYTNLEYSNHNWYHDSPTNFRSSAPNNCYNYLYHSVSQ